MVHLYRTPKILPSIFKNLHWRVPVSDKEIFLTFDDGPIPYLTEYVIDQLNEFDAKATFFCVGDNIRKHPEVFKKIIQSGNAIGNHTFNHLKAWNTELSEYIDNVTKCRQLIQSEYPGAKQLLFRPPHGQITRKTISVLKNDYRIIMWDILTYDFDNKHSPEKSLRKILAYTKPGSIVVFHDNYKAEEKLKFILPRYLAHFSELGYKFKKLSMD